MAKSQLSSSNELPERLLEKLDRCGVSDECFAFIGEKEDQWRSANPQPLRDAEASAAMALARPFRGQILTSWLERALLLVMDTDDVTDCQRHCLFFSVAQLLDAYRIKKPSSSEVDATACVAITQLAIKSLFGESFLGPSRFCKLWMDANVCKVDVQRCEIQVIRSLGWHLDSPTVATWLMLFRERALIGGLTKPLVDSTYALAVHFASQAVLAELPVAAGPSSHLARGVWFQAAMHFGILQQVDFCAREWLAWTTGCASDAPVKVALQQQPVSA